MDTFHFNGVNYKLGNFPAPYGYQVRASRPLPKIDLATVQPFEYPENVVQIKDQGQYGACFPAGTRVRMEDGTEKKIEDIKVLDRVLTGEGNIGRVIRTMVRDADDGLYRIVLWGHSHLRCTSEHPILTRRGYVPASDLTEKDWVAMPRYLPESNKFVLAADHLPKRYMTTRAGRSKRSFNSPEGRPAVTVRITDIPDVIELTPGVGRIFGLFLAEGHTDSSRVAWTFGTHEDGTLVKELCELLSQEWDVEAHVQHRPNNSTVVVIYGKPWSLLFESLCATGSGSKRIHSSLIGGPRDFLENLLNGWLDGDGHGRRTEIQGVIVSRELALGMYDIAQALGRRPAIRTYQSPTYGKVRSRQPRWEVSMGLASGDNYRCESDENTVWRKVREVIREDFQGPVFNLEVEGDNSYVAEGLSVHNCNGHAAASSLEWARWIANPTSTYQALSAWYVYAILCGGIDRGSSISEALQLLQDQGTCLDGSVQHGTINPRRLTDANKAEAARFKIEVGQKLTSYDEMIAAAALRRPFNFSVCVGNNFTNLDSNGVVGFTRGTGNHAVTGGLGLKKGPDGDWLVKGQNSWTTQFGLKGYFWVSRRHIEQQSWFDCYDVIAVESDPQDADKPPVAV